jgi:L-lactate dehydrogenase complex protein LldG
VTDRSVSTSPGGGRERILNRIRTVVGRRTSVPHPGPFAGWRAGTREHPIDSFVTMFRTAGGEVARVRDRKEATSWVAAFSTDFASMTVGETVAEALIPDLPRVPTDVAELGLSQARCAIGETGSLVLDARDGRRTQLLAPHHVVLVDESIVVATLYDALVLMRDDLPSAIGLHSGPSKSADIGQIMVKGVHGPGRVVALLIKEP